MQKSSNRPTNPVIPDYRPKVERNKEVQGLPPTPCIICTEMTKGYGPWAAGYTCSPQCEEIQENKPKYPDHQPKE